MTKKPNRRNVPLFVVLPPDERARVDAFAAAVGRPNSWVVRDALRLYLDAMEKNTAALARLKLDAADAGKTKQPRRGRPRGYGAGAVKPIKGTPADLEAEIKRMNVR